jgi:hypothetical protein
MKKLTQILLLAIIVVSCKNTPAPLKLNTYKIEISRLGLNFDGSALQDEVKEDTVMAINDTIAYQKALIVP